MVVLNQPGSDDSRNYDMSFMYTKRCNLACSFCMYNSGPKVSDALDLDRLRKFLDTVDTTRIASWGFYGGEVSIALDGYSHIVEMLPAKRPRFVITNGAWSRYTTATTAFLDWCAKYSMFVVISGTPEHRRFQNRQVLEALQRAQPDAFRLKPEEENFHPMGRLANDLPVVCSRKCMTWNRALRVAVQPDGTVIFQNCDGVYPVVGTIDENFEVLDSRIKRLRQAGFKAACPHYERNAVSK